MTFIEFQKHLNNLGYDFVINPKFKRFRIYPNDENFIGSAVFSLLEMIGCNDYFVNCENHDICLICNFDF